MSLKISVIIPIYNSANYLAECLDSIVNQSYKELDIILINDGSTDKSRSIAEKYVKKDDRIILINKENGGQASARNRGLDKATGDYISFVDSDDTISLDLYDECVSALNKPKNVDVIQFPIYMDYGLDSAYLKAEQVQFIQHKEALFKKWIRTNTISWLVCNKLFKKDIFLNLRFREDMVYEDNYMIADVLSKISNLFIIDKSVYYYHSRIDSTTTSKHSLKKEIDTQKVNFHILKKIKDLKGFENEKIIIINKILNVYQSIIHNYDKDFEIDKNFIIYFNKTKFSNIITSQLVISQKLKMVLVKFIGVINFLKLYRKQ